MRIDWLEKHRALSGLLFGAASYYGTIDSGSDVVNAYDSFITNDADTFALNSETGRLNINDDGLYAFFATGYVYPSGSPPLTDEVGLVHHVTAEFPPSAIPSGFYWPDFGMIKVTGYATGTPSWSPHELVFRTYSDASYPCEEYIGMTIPFDTSNCIVSCLVVRLADGIDEPTPS